MLTRLSNTRLWLITGLVAAMALSACAPMGNGGGRWEKVPADARTIHVEANSFSTQVPTGWMRANFVIQNAQGNRVDLGNQLLLTRDGLALNSIYMYRLLHDIAFPRTEQMVDEDTLPSELARYYIAELKADGDMENMKTITNRPARFAKRKGFHLHLQITTGEGLRLERQVYGVNSDLGIYILEYSAPSLHYFKKHAPAFKKMVTSFTIDDE